MPNIRNVYRQATSDGNPFWRVLIIRQGKSYQKTFWDGTHGGQEEALKAAIAYRDAIYKRKGEPARSPTTWGDRNAPPDEGIVKSSKTRARFGIPGYTLETKTLADGSLSHNLIVTASPKDMEMGMQRRRSFSFNTWRIEDAVWRAVRWRLRVHRWREPSPDPKDVADTIYKAICQHLKAQGERVPRRRTIPWQMKAKPIES
jgi:hypothetical protein